MSGGCSTRCASGSRDVDLVTTTARTACVYSLGTSRLSAEQILLRGDALYLCAPLGQLVEGFLAIAPYECVPCLAALEASAFPELRRMCTLVAAFYAEAYGVTRPTWYEQGRAGGGAIVDAAAGFSRHPDLCSVPMSVDLRAPLAARYAERALSGPEVLAETTEGEPYLYVESAGKRFVYVARSAESRSELEASRLKPLVAQLAGIPERGDWR